MMKENDILHTKLARQVGGAIACLLALALLLGLTACGGGQAKAPEPAVPPKTESAQTTRTEPTPPVEPEEPDVTPEVTPPDDDDHDGFPEPEEDEDPPMEHTFTQEEYDQVVADVLESIIEDDMTPLEQAKAVFLYVHNNIRYVGKADKEDWVNGAYVGLTTQKGDCFTYYAVSRALLDALGIDNLPVERVGGKTLHFWNLVNCGDGWYHFDACPRSLKMPIFNSFMVTDKQVAAFTALAGRNYYDFDASLLPERATEQITKTWPTPRPPEEEEPEATDPAADVPDEPTLPPEETEGDPNAVTDPTVGPVDPAANPGEDPGEDPAGNPDDNPVLDPGEPTGGEDPSPELGAEPPVEELPQPELPESDAPQDAGPAEIGGTEAA